jgi:HlyD family secretion protein
MTKLPDQQSSNSNTEQKKLVRATKNPENLNEVTKIIEPKLQQLFVLAGLSLSGLLAWSIFARIPVTVPGKSVLMAPNSMSRLTAQTSGRLYFTSDMSENIVNDIREFDKEVKLILDDGNNNNINYERLKSLIPLTKKFIDIGLKVELDYSNISPTNTAKPIKVSANEPIAFIFSREDAIATLDAIKGYLNEVSEVEISERNASVLSAAYGDLFNNQSQMLLKAKELHMRGSISTNQLNSIESEVNNFNSQKLQQDKLKTNANILSNKSALSLLSKLSRSSQRVEVKNIKDGYVVNNLVKSGMVVDKGDTIANFLTDSSIESPMKVLSFLPLSSYKNIATGNKALITPTNIQKSKYGSIVGTVESIEPIPLGINKASILLGGESLATTIFDQSKAMISVTVLLNKGQTFTGYEWSSSRGPDYPITIGTTGTSEIITEYIAPISIALPFIKQFI